MVQDALRNTVVISGKVAGELAFKLRRGDKKRLPAQVTDTSVDALDHAISLTMARPG